MVHLLPASSQHRERTWVGVLGCLGPARPQQQSCLHTTGLQGRKAKCGSELSRGQVSGSCVAAAPTGQGCQLLEFSFFMRWQLLVAPQPCEMTASCGHRALCDGSMSLRKATCSATPVPHGTDPTYHLISDALALIKGKRPKHLVHIIKVFLLLLHHNGCVTDKSLA